MLQELDLDTDKDDKVQKLTVLYEDNQSAISLAKNPVYHACSKHIEIQHHFIRSKVETREIELIYLLTTEMIADALTKPLPKPQFEYLTNKMQLRYDEKSDDNNDEYKE